MSCNAVTRSCYDNRVPLTINRFDTMQKLLLLLAAACLTSTGMSQVFDRAYLEQLSRERFPLAGQQLNTFLEIPKDGHYPDQLEKNAAWCLAAFRERHFDAKVLETEAPPLVFAQRIIDPKRNLSCFTSRSTDNPSIPASGIRRILTPRY